MVSHSFAARQNSSPRKVLQIEIAAGLVGLGEPIMVKAVKDRRCDLLAAAGEEVGVLTRPTSGTQDRT